MRAGGGGSITYLIQSSKPYSPTATHAAQIIAHNILVFICDHLSYILLKRISAPIAALNNTILVRANMIANSFTHHKKFLIILLLYLVRLIVL